MKSVVMCPWCGGRMSTAMEKRTYHELKPITAFDAYCICGDCGATGPKVFGRNRQGDAMADARAYAERLYQPIRKPLTLEEIAQKDFEDSAAWIEFNSRADCAVLPIIFRTVKDGVAWTISYHREEIGRPLHEYGKRFRFWKNKPSDKERTCAKWEA